MARSPIDKAKALEEQAKARAKTKASKKTPAKKKAINVSTRGYAYAKLKSEAEAQIKQFAEESGLNQLPLFPRNEYPTPFTRLPIFQPIQTRRAAAKIAERIVETNGGRGRILRSPWDNGGVEISNEVLTTYDEDTLIGILKLRSMKLEGDAMKLPSKAAAKLAEATGSSAGPKTAVHTCVFLASQVETVIRGHPPPNRSKGWSGTVIKKRRESIERLAKTTLIFSQQWGERKFAGKTLKQYINRSVRLIEIQSISDAKDALYYGEISPVMSYFLESYRTFIDLEVRRELTPLGKALHKFLASQRSNPRYKEDFSRILDAVGIEGRIADSKARGSEQLEKMKKLGFLKAYRFKGNGRSEPFVLEVDF